MRVLFAPLAPEVAADIPETAQTLILRVRLPRLLAALLIGASMAGTGAAFQGIFKTRWSTRTCSASRQARGLARRWRCS
ncbi:MAG: iron chelate uptake ABC transporter family permease subunit [Anaerolineae bacterium]|nr:iron chelate uptake ABC transporter family permease subunit [Anaerolineae bacterium]